VISEVADDHNINRVLINNVFIELLLLKVDVRQILQIPFMDACVMDISIWRAHQI